MKIGPAEGAVPSENPQIKEAARGFEAILIRQLWSAVRRSDLSGDAAGGQRSQINAMFDSRLAEVLAGKVGLAQWIEKNIGLLAYKEAEFPADNWSGG